ncbi:MAG: DNA primase [Candidatus Zixiibacteriota bacterium]
MIPAETIEQVRQATDIAQVIGEFVRLKKRGRNFLGLCPFHTEKTPSFNVNPDRQIFHCFGCGKGGNIFSFLMEHEKMSFVEAVRFLASKANITIREAATDVKREQFERLNYANQIALDYFHKVLFQSKYAVVLDKYLRSQRQISDESIELFKIGLSGEEWDGLIKYARCKDVTSDDLHKAGLASFSETRKSYFDLFRQRLMIPIFNLSQKPVAFGGRTLKKGEQAKYVNSPETPLYTKGNLLYGLNFSRDHIRQAGAAYIVEGYFDLISLWQVGVQNVVASSGTAFTPQQARLLARFCDEVYLFFDADSAGQNAALRSVEHLYDAGLEVKVMPALPGEDPDSISRKFGRGKVEELRLDAIGFIPFRVKRVNLDNAGIIAKEKLVKELSALGSKIGDPTRRTLFFAEAAVQIGVEPGIFKASSPARGTPEQSNAGAKARQHQMEMDYVSLLLANPGSIDTAFEAVSPDDLDSKQLSRLYAAMIQQYKAVGIVNAATLVQNLADDATISLLTELASREWAPEVVDGETRRYIGLIAERKRKRIRAQLQKELAAAEASGDQKTADALLQQLKSFGL